MLSAEPKILHIDKNNYIKIFLFVYSIFFILMSIIIFYPHIATNKAFMWEADGYNVYYKHLLWYSRNLKNLFFSHKFTFNLFDFYANEGLDTTLMFGGYIIGDPLYVFSVLVPEQYMHYYYSFIQLVKIYLSGISFSLLCININKIANLYALLLSSLNYSFCFFNICNITKHPHFLSALIYMPLILIGINKAIKERKILFLVITVAIAAFHSFYLLYTIALLSGIYTLYVVFFNNDVLSNKLINLKNVIIGATIGVLVAAPKILPMLDIYLSENRMSSNYNLDIFYELGYYLKIPSMFITYSSRNWLCLGYSFLIIIALIVLFTNKKNFIIKMFVITSVLFIIFPVFGKALNGFTYVTNRWSWVLALIYMYVLFKMWDWIFYIKVKGMIFLGIIIAFYIIFHIIINRYYNLPLKIQIVFLCLSLILLILCRTLNIKHINTYIFVICILSIVLNGYFANADHYGNFASMCITNNKIEKMNRSNEAEEIKKYYNGDLVYNPIRYSGNGLNNGIDFLYNMSSTSHDNSLSNPYQVLFRKNLNITTYATHFEDYDARAGLLSLNNIMYYVSKSNKKVPYGFECINEYNKKDYYVYENKNYLPVVYQYDKCIDVNDFDKLNSIEKEEVMLDYCVCDQSYVEGEYFERKDNINKNLTSKKIKYKLNNSSNVTSDKNKFIVNKDNGKLTVKIGKHDKNSEIYFLIKGLTFKAFSTYDLYFNKSISLENEVVNIDKKNQFTIERYNKLQDSTKKAIEAERLFFGHGKESTNVTASVAGKNVNIMSIVTSFHQNYLGIEDFVLNLGNSLASKDVIELSFQYKGIYCFDSISIIQYAHDSLGEHINNRRISDINDIVIMKDKLATSFNTRENKLICIAIPYNKHFKLYINGYENKIFPLNIYHIGFIAKKGLNNIELVYCNKYVILGYIISFLTILSNCSILFIKRKGKKIK